MQQSKPARRWLFISIALGIFSGLLIILQSGILATIIDRVYLHHATRAQLFSFLFLFVVIVILRAMMTGLREPIACRAAVCIKDAVRKQCIEKLFALSPEQLSHYKTGALTSALVEQIEALHGFFSDYFPQMTITVILPLIIVGVVFTQNWIAGLILLITAPLIPLFMAFIGMNTAKLNQENFQTLARMSANFLDRLQGLTTLVLFNRARTQCDDIRKTSDDYRQKTMQILRIAFLSTAALELFSTIAIAMIAVYLGLGLLGFVKMGFDGVSITLQQALFILLLAPEFFSPLRQLGTFYHARAEAIGAADEILKISSLPDNNTECANEKINDSVTTLTFNNICFSYAHEKKIIDDFNLSLHAGDCVAITGPSGAGKSTLLNMIAKFIVPSSGVIAINEKDLRDIETDHWREKIALLHQHPRLFHGTLADNIRLGKSDASDHEVENAARITGVLDFSQQLPQGLNTLIGEQNLGLSGGQAQRVALARIVLKDAPIILLDEPTSYLDQKNTVIILNLLAQWQHHKTLIIATHDHHIIKQVTRVVTLLKQKTG